MPVRAAIRLTAHLNHAARTGQDRSQAAAEVVADDVAHHVFEAGSAGSTDLATALTTRIAQAGPGWVLALPRPGALLPLRGPAELTAAALDAGAAVIASDGGTALVPHRVGPALQWQVLEAAAPQIPQPISEADRHLRETILSAGDELASLGLVGGTRPAEAHLHLPLSYGGRSQKALLRGLDILAACDAALSDQTEILHSHAIAVRTRALTELRTAALATVCSVVSWGSGI